MQPPALPWPPAKPRARRCQEHPAPAIESMTADKNNSRNSSAGWQGPSSQGHPPAASRAQGQCLHSEGSSQLSRAPPEPGAVLCQRPGRVGAGGQGQGRGEGVVTGGCKQESMQGAPGCQPSVQHRHCTALRTQGTGRTRSPSSQTQPQVGWEQGSGGRAAWCPRAANPWSNKATSQQQGRLMAPHSSAGSSSEGDSFPCAEPWEPLPGQPLHTFIPDSGKHGGTKPL